MLNIVHAAYYVEIFAMNSFHRILKEDLDELFLVEATLLSFF